MLCLSDILLSSCVHCSYLNLYKPLQNFLPSLSPSSFSLPLYFLPSWTQVLGLDAEFARLWNYYLCYCEAGFEKQVLVRTNWSYGGRLDC